MNTDKPVLGTPSTGRIGNLGGFIPLVWLCQTSVSVPIRVSSVASPVFFHGIGVENFKCVSPD